MNMHLCLRPIAVIAGAALLAPACTERVLDMDGPTPVVNTEATKGAADDVVVVLNEQINELQSDGTRLYWYGQTPDTRCYREKVKALRSCRIDQCADTLVTYAAWSIGCTPEDIQDTGGRSASGTVSGTLGTFSTDGASIYWDWGKTLLSCPISGCDPTSNVVFSGDMTFYNVKAEKLYWLNDYNPLGLQRCVPARCADTVETIADFSAQFATTVQGLTLDSTHAFWITGSQIRRVALDGLSAVETIVSSPTQPNGLTIADGDIYWANYDFPGTITRCTTAGCGNAKPTVIVEEQTYPTWTGVIGASLFWTNTNGFADEVELVHCTLADCSGSIESLEPMANLILGRWIQGDGLYFGTSADGGATTAIHRRKF